MSHEPPPRSLSCHAGRRLPTPESLLDEVFLQSGTDSDIRVDASFLQPDGSSGSRWDIYMKGPGEFQLDKIQRREGTGR